MVNWNTVYNWITRITIILLVALTVLVVSSTITNRAKSNIPPVMTGIVKFFLPDEREDILIVSQGWSSGMRCQFFISEVAKSAIKRGAEVKEQTCKELSGE